MFQANQTLSVKKADMEITWKSMQFVYLILRSLKNGKTAAYKFFSMTIDNAYRA